MLSTEQIGSEMLTCKISWIVVGFVESFIIIGHPGVYLIRRPKLIECDKDVKIVNIDK